jgi:hypothetical protein
MRSLRADSRDTQRMAKGENPHMGARRSIALSGQTSRRQAATNRDSVVRVVVG